MSRNIRICLAQIEVIPGNPAANTAKMLDAIRMAKEDRADLIVFPEMAIPGYILGDTWERRAFIEECYEYERDIVGASEGIVTIFGNITHDPTKVNEDGRVRKYNTAVVAACREVVDMRIKTLQPNYREFDDNRHFYDYRKLMADQLFHANTHPLSALKPVTYAEWVQKSFTHSVIVNGIKIGVMLCEDGWDDDYTLSPAAHLYSDCDMILNISCSPFTFGKNGKRNRVFSKKAKTAGKPLVYVNCVGVQNNGKTIYTFDGNSCIYDKQGEMLNPFRTFTERVKTIEIDLDGNFGSNVQYKLYNQAADEPDTIATIHDSITYGLTKFMKAAKIEKVVIGASGGIDSSVVAALICPIIGKENLTLVNMPSRFNSTLTKNAAQQLAANLGCRYVVIPVEESATLTRTQLAQSGLALTDFAMENVQARDRSSRILAAVAASVGGAFTCNANKSEMTVGYTTLYGDLGGFIAPISDLWKGQVYELARFINSCKNPVIPQESIDVVPSAELSAQQDVTKGLGDPLVYPYHDKLFMSWVERWERASPEDNLRWYLNGTLAKEIGYEGDVKKLFPTAADFIRDLEKWWNCYCGLAVAKRIQAPPVLAVSRRAFGFDHRETQVPPHYTKGYLALKGTICT
jgi:NAD+ synthase (glutamine-hydrolysing)